MRWPYVVVMLGFFALVAYGMNLRAENKRIKMELEKKNEK